jgi:hypothetical protein
VEVSEWEKRKLKKIVSIAMGSGTIHHGVNRNLKHNAILRCAVCSWEHLIRHAIMSQKSENIREELMKEGIEFRRHLTLKGSQKA